MPREKGTCLDLPRFDEHDCRVVPKRSSPRPCKGDDSDKLTLAAHAPLSASLQSLGSGSRELQSWLVELP